MWHGWAHPISPNPDVIKTEKTRPSLLMRGQQLAWQLGRMVGAEGGSVCVQLSRQQLWWFELLFYLKLTSVHLSKTDVERTSSSIPHYSALHQHHHHTEQTWSLGRQQDLKHARRGRLSFT